MIRYLNDIALALLLTLWRGADENTFLWEKNPFVKNSDSLSDKKNLRLEFF